jgi:hypothetical protein
MVRQPTADGAKANPWFLTRGVVLVVRDMETLDWPARAVKAGLSTIATHIRPAEIAEFVKTDAGRKFLADCRKEGIHVEHDLHALSELLPRVPAVNVAATLTCRNMLLYRMLQLHISKQTH